MNCPIDGTVLVMTDRNGVEIDYCPQCRGVWLDRGELDKIIDRAAPAARQGEGSHFARGDERGYNREHGQGYSYGTKKHRKKKSFLDDLFDF